MAARRHRHGARGPGGVAKAGGQGARGAVAGSRCSGSARASGDITGGQSAGCTEDVLSPGGKPMQLCVGRHANIVEILFQDCRRGRHHFLVRKKKDDLRNLPKIVCERELVSFEGGVSTECGAVGTRALDLCSKMRCGTPAKSCSSYCRNYLKVAVGIVGKKCKKRIAPFLHYQRGHQGA